MSISGRGGGFANMTKTTQTKQGQSCWTPLKVMLQCTWWAIQSSTLQETFCHDPWSAPEATNHPLVSEPLSCSDEITYLCESIVPEFNRNHYRPFNSSVPLSRTPIWRALNQFWLKKRTHIVDTCKLSLLVLFILICFVFPGYTFLFS